MSVDYYMACEACKECYWVGQDGLSGFTFYSGEPRCMKGLPDFLEEHVLCGGEGPRLMPEQHVEDFKQIDWPSNEPQSPRPTEE